MKRAGEPCAKALRRLTVRATDEYVVPGGVKTKKWGDTGQPYTDTLVSCIGVAVIGDDSTTHQRVRVLGHFFGSKMANEPVFETFKRERENAYLDKAKPITLVMSVPNQYGAPPAGKQWAQADIEGGEEAEVDLRGKLEGYLGVCVTKLDRRMHGLDPQSTMSIEGDGRIYRDNGQIA